jgi:hypothetical protein
MAAPACARIERPDAAEIGGINMRSAFVWILAVAGLVFFAAAGPSSAEEFKYIGAAKCKTCHKKELIGDQYGAWEKGQHSKAFETLKTPKAAEVAKAQGIAGPAYEADECLKCHTTGHGLPASAFAKNPLKPEDGVQCESCHGPGSAYKKKKTMADHAKSVAAGMWEPDKDEKICTTCHNDSSPTWDPAKGFNFEERKEKIAHKIPADVKGKYIELSKQKGD